MKIEKELQNILQYQFSDTLEFEVLHNILDDRKRNEKTSESDAFVL